MIPRPRATDLLAALGELVAAESPSGDEPALRRCADAVAALAVELIGAVPRRITGPAGAHLWWDLGAHPRVLVLGHYDTVWPRGTIRRWPFTVTDAGTATGPGVFDMKAGIVQGLFGIAGLEDPSGVRLVLTADEETGSATSRELVLEAATGMDAVLVLEPSAAGAPKVARKGVSQYRIEVHGRAAHAGLEPQKGVNALLGLAHVVLAAQALADETAGTTVTPTVAAAGTAGNVVPARAWCDVDVRAATAAEQQRVDAAMGTLAAGVAGAAVRVSGGINRPPLERGSSDRLGAALARAAAAAGVQLPPGVAVGGASDGNFTAAAGVATLDGLGAVGDGAHAEGEHIVLATLPERAALCTALLAELTSRGSDAQAPPPA